MSIYISECCKVKAKKPALIKPKKDESVSGLGKWRCSNCNQKTKVQRRKNDVQ